MTRPDSLLLAGMDGSALILPAAVLAALTVLAAEDLPDFAPRSFTLEDGPASGEEALALAGVLARPWVDVVLSGAAAAEQLHSNLAALAVPWDRQAGEMARGLAESPEDYWHTRARLPWN